MDELNLDADDLMDLDDHEGGSDLEDDDDDEPLPSPLQLPSSGPASTATSAASSPPANDEMISPMFNYSGKPMSIKRGRGRPRRDAGGKPIPRKLSLGSGGMRMKRWKPGGMGGGGMRGGLKRPKSFDRGDFEFASGVLQSPASEDMILDAETGALVLIDKPTAQPAVPEESPYCPEQWPGKVCGFCNLTERSQLGQGEMLRLTCPADLRAHRSSPAHSVGSSPTANSSINPNSLTPTSSNGNSVSTVVASVAAGSDGCKPSSEQGDKSPRGPVTCRRQKSFHKSRNPSVTNEYVEELTIIGYIEEPELQMIFDTSGYFYVHRSCALWSQNVEITENQGLENVGQALRDSCSRKCAHCNHYGASATCKSTDCTKVFHYPCATAAAAFQELSSRLLFCSLHLGEVPTACENSVCYTCKLQGDILNLMYCSLCGVHYHGTCVGLAQLPGVRSGWQCRKCKICQVCRMAGDETKLMSCEQCDKVYHSMCQRPVATSIPKYGWKCRCCRVCGDCGSRTPGAGLSSRWHAHYTVCDSCYQQRNKGFCCPICHRAYRAHAHREMVQCRGCSKFVHGTCDPDADLTTYTQRKEAHPDYEYACAVCKGISQSTRQLIAKRHSIDEDSLSASQESLYDDMSEFDTVYPEEHMRTIGIGKGKPYSACKIAKKRLGIHSGLPGRPKGVGKGMGSGGPGCVAGKIGFMKRHRMTEFGRKRGTKYKMRGMFGVPGVGLQKPVGDSRSQEEEPGIENKMILCSAKDKFVLTQDLCVMCGAIGTDQEGCLIACVQCGQCYHPYCVNVKVTKIILQKGWRCLDCTVCEGCGQRNDESRLTLCDDCDISYHIYCMEPPLDYVPHGNWKCRWCAQCQRCGSTDPGFNCGWMNSFSECGPCASHANCPVCMEGYSDGELIIQCVQCERWLHGSCDSIKNDQEAERCAEDGYNCILCRPRDVAPPHLLPVPIPKPPTPTKSPEVKPNTYYYMDGVCLTDSGNNQIKSLNTEHIQARKKRTKRLPTVQDKEASILASIESVIAGNGNVDCSLMGLLDDEAMMLDEDYRMDESELYKEGMLWTKADGPPPQGFTIYTVENGTLVLRRKRQRNLQKLGIGGFLVRVRGIRTGGPDATDDVDTLPGQQQSPATVTDPSTSTTDILPSTGDTKPRRKPIRRKLKSKLSETFPLYLQEAFFGREILECGRREELLPSQTGSRSTDDASDEEEEDSKVGIERKSNMDRDKTIQLSQDELKAVAAVTVKHEPRNEANLQKTEHQSCMVKEQDQMKDLLTPKEEDESDSDFSLAFPKELLDTDIDKLMSEDISELTKATDDSDLPMGNSSSSKDTKDELSDILGSHFNLPNINSKDVEDIFKGVLTDESQESQESTTTTNNTPTSTPYPNASMGSNSNSSSAASATSMFATTAIPPGGLLSQQSSTGGGGVGVMGASGRPGTLPGVTPQQVNVQTQGSLPSPMSFPPQSPYHSEFSNSPQFSPAFSEPPSPWISHHAPSAGSSTNADMSSSNDFLDATTSSTSLPPSIPSGTNNQRSSEKMKADEGLGPGATISAVLYANMNHTEWRSEFPGWSDRYKQIIKKWRTLSTEQKAPYLQQAKDNRAALRIKKQTQCSGVSDPIGSHKADSSSSGSGSGPGSTTTGGTVTGGSTGSGSASASPIAAAVAVATPSPAAAPVTPSSSSTASSSPTTHVTPPPMAQLPAVNGNGAPQSEDQEKIAQQHKTAREAEQERQWKHLQAMRQQQAQQQQHNIHEQRVQAIVRVQRQLSEGGPPGFISTEPQPVEPQNIVNSPVSAGPEVNRQLRDLLQFKKLEDQLTPGKANQRVWPPHQPDNIPGQQDLMDSVGMDQQQQQHQQQIDGTFRQPLPPANVGRPRMVAMAGVGAPAGAQAAAAAAAAAAAGALRGPGVVGGMRLPMDPRMRLILQQQQLQRNIPQTAQQLVQLPNQYQQQGGLIQQQQQRFGLPQVQAQLAQPGPRTITPEQFDLLQQRNNPIVPQQQQFIGQQQQLQSPQRPQMVLGRVGLVQIGPQGGVNLQPQSQQQQLQQQQVVQQQQSPTGAVLPSPTGADTTPPTGANEATGPGNDPGEIPDNVTAELEKLEQEGGGDEPGMEEIQGVGDFFGVGDHDDDDELLAEMGADFNILEYADPELDALAGGEKTNILDSLDLVEPEPQQQRQRQENKVQIKKEEPSASPLPQPSPISTQSQPIPPSTPVPVPISQAMTPVSSNNPVTTSAHQSPMLALIKQEHPPPLQTPQSHPQPPPQQMIQQQQMQQNSQLPPLQPLAIQPQQMHPVQHLSLQSIQQQQQILLQQQQQVLQQQQQLQQQQHQPQQIPLAVQHQVHQQFLQQLQQAASGGRPIQPGTKMMLPDGVTGVLLHNNNISISFPPNYNQKMLHIQQQKIQLRLNQLQAAQAQANNSSNNQQQQPRILHQPHQQQLLIHHQGALQQSQQRLQQQLGQQQQQQQQQQVVAPPPPPPPYPGPPPPYPGSANQEQPLLLEDLLEQEKRELEKQQGVQQQQQPLVSSGSGGQEVVTSANIGPGGNSAGNTLLSDHDFERLTADVINTSPSMLPGTGSNQMIGSQPQQRLPYNPTAQIAPRLPLVNQQQQSWQQPPPLRQTSTPALPQQQPSTSDAAAPRPIATFQAHLLAAPPLPPEHIVTEQDRQTQVAYEHWLHHQNGTLAQQLKYYETEVQKLRKSKKSLNSKQRQLRKTGGQLTEPDAAELLRITSDQSALQKHLESSRKQSRQHGMLMQEYQTKHVKQLQPQVVGAQAQVQLLPQQQQLQQQQSPLGRPASSPIHQPGMGAPQSPAIIHSPSPSVASPIGILPHQSPLHSPSPHLISHSPGGQQLPPAAMQSSPSGGAHSITSSPRIGTPLSQQGDSSPVASPGGVGVYLPPPPIRMTSPQHRRVVTSPLGYGGGGGSGLDGGVGVVRSGGTPVGGVVMQTRFMRPQLEQAQLQQQQLRMRLQHSPQGPNFSQKPGTPSPLNSPPQQTQQQYLQRQLQQQVYLQQQQQQQQQQLPTDEGLGHSQRTQQMIHQRQLIHKQQGPGLPSGAMHQPAALTPQQHQLMVQQQQQLHKQQVARLQQQQVQVLQQSQPPPSSPMPPQSPLQHQIMSPHHHGSQPASPMPPRSPMVVGAYQQQQPPSSPMMPRSPAVSTGQQMHQPPSSPMQMQGGVTSPMMTMMPSPMGHRRPPSVANLSSPAMPERPVSVENPGTPRTPYSSQDMSAMDEQQHIYTSISQHSSSLTQTSTTTSTSSGGGGNPNNPSTPIPFPPCFGRFGSFKIGLRGGAPPMWPGNTYTIRPTRPQPQQTTGNDEATSSTSQVVVNQSTIVTSSSGGSIPVPSMSVINITHPGGLKMKKESHRNKVTILKKNSPVRSNMALLAAQGANAGLARRVQSLVSVDYNEFDDSSSTPPVTPPPGASGLNRYLSKTSGKRIPEKPTQTTTITVSELPTKEVVIVQSAASSSVGKQQQQQVDDIVDYDDDIDNNLVSTEVTLSDAAQQNDGDDMTVIETFSQSDLADAMSSPLESHQIADDFIFFDMPTGDQYSDKEDGDEDYSGELEGMDDKDNTHIINVAIQSPTSSEEELILQGKTKQVSMDLTDHLLTVTDTPDSPEPEEMNVDPPDSPETSEPLTPFDDADIVIIDQPGTSKSLEEQISTKEDFEELIDEGSRKEKLVVKPKQQHQTSYSANPVGVFNFNPKQVKTINTSGPSGNIITTTLVRPSVSVIPGKVGPQPPKISLIRSPNTVTISKTVVTQGLKVRTMPNLVPTSTPAITIVRASNSQIAQILQTSRSSAPVISASAINKLPNVKFISHQEMTLPNKIFEDDSVSPDSSNNEEDKKSDESDTPTKVLEVPPPLVKQEVTITNVKVVNIETKLPVVKPEQKVEISKPLQTTIPTPSAIVHHPPPPELKMTAQIIEDSPPNISSNADVDSMDCGSTDDTKSVVISIPSPTPSQEQYLTNLSLQELENDRREGNRVGEEFESFEDVLDMIENYAGASESSIREGLESKEPLMKSMQQLEQREEMKETAKATISQVNNHPLLVTSTEIPASAITLTTTTRLSVIPQLSPLSQPAELATNISNVSQQLRTLLSNLQTTTSTTTNVIESVVRNSVKDKVDPPPPKLIPVTSQPIQPNMSVSVFTSAVTTSSSVLLPNKPKVVLVTSTTSPPLGGLVSSAMTPTTPPITAVVTTMSGQHPALSSLVAAGRIPLTEHPKLAPLSNTVPIVAPPIIATCIPATLTSISTPAGINVSSSNFLGSVATVSSSQMIQQQRKPSLSLNAMLQSHPAATVPQTSPGTITTASILGSSAAITKASFSPALAQAQPHVAVTTPLTQLAAVTTSILSISSPSAFVAKPTMATSNLLHSQLTKSPVVRTPKPEEEKKVELLVPKIEPMDTQDCPITTSALLKTQDSGNKFTPTPPPNRMEDSQNVLLKQLLQNTACASSQSTIIKSEVLSTTPPATAPNLPLVPNLEAQLARPVPPISTSLLPPIIQQSEQYSKVVTRAPIMSRETSFVSKPVTPCTSPVVTIPPPVMTATSVAVASAPPPPQIPVNQQFQQHQQQQQFVQQQIMQQQQQLFQPHSQMAFVQQQSITQSTQQVLPHQQLHIDIKKCAPASRTPSRDEILSPPTPRSSCSQDSSLQTPPLVIKKEVVTLPTPLQSPIFQPQEVKKEFTDDTSQHSEVSDHSKSDMPIKEEMDIILDAERQLQEKEEAKKQKRRQYQAKRRQNQIMKENAAAVAGITAALGATATAQPKKRPRKTSKVDEDYESYIESVLNQIRQLPPLNVSEPILTKNYLAVPIHGCGDLSKISSPDFNPLIGDLEGKYGDAIAPGYTDYYDTKPYGDLDALPEKPPASTQRGFYDQEFPLIRFEEQRRFDQFARDDTPDSIVSCSSPEPSLDELQKPAKSSRFPGLGLINEDDDDELDMDGVTPQITGNRDRLSPIVPLITPIPIRLKPITRQMKDYTTDLGKENSDTDLAKQRAKSNTTPLKDNAGNVTVTLTLTSAAAEDIMGVLRDLANILQIPAPTTYQIVERTTSPPCQKLGLYRTKGKDGKEGAPIDIQSILNGAAKFCRHCDVVILNNMIRKRFSELPFLSKELATEGDELYFCSSTCYMQFALMHRSPSIPEDKAAAIVDHICQKDPNDPTSSTPTIAAAILEKQRMDKLDILLNRGGSHSFMKDMATVGFDLKRESVAGGLHKFRVDQHSTEEVKPEKPKSWRGTRFKIYSHDCLQPTTKFKRPTDKEIMEMMYRLRITVMPTKIPEDSRRCMFCHNLSDAVADGAGRLLNYDADRWIHLNCGLWSDGVYETVNGALMNIPTALKHSLNGICAHCERAGATVRCFKTRCGSIYHLGCAVKDGCTFYKNKSVYCSAHVPKGEKENELTTLSVSRRVYVDRDENSQVATVMHHSDLNHLLRVGSLIFLSVGQLLPHQLPHFHTPNYIFPIGYKIIRFYWSMRRMNKRCRYICSIHEVHTKPEFRVLVQEPGEEDVEFRANSCKSVWLNVLEPLATLRREGGCVRIFPRYVSGEDLFGLTEPAVVRVLESLPGIETLADYKFKYGRNPLLELPLAINPSGAARTEAKLRNQLHWKRPHTQRTTGNSSSPNSTTPTPGSSGSTGGSGSNIRTAFSSSGSSGTSGGSSLGIGSVLGGSALGGGSIGEGTCPYSKQFVHSKSSQYKKMKQEWRNNVYLARSKIQGLGLYAAKDLEKHTMVIEYIGEIIRAELAETRERKYEARNRGIYMFRLDEERVVDASESGGLARYINHSCNPNCVAEIVEVERDLRIIIFAKRRIQRGEELAYDYKFDIEDDQHKISCMCGAPNCRKWMN